jgi:hypothetical protein
VRLCVCACVLKHPGTIPKCPRNASFRPILLPSPSQQYQCVHGALPRRIATGIYPRAGACEGGGGAEGQTLSPTMETFLGAAFGSAETRIFLPAGDVILVLGAARRLACACACVLSPCARSRCALAAHHLEQSYGICAAPNSRVGNPQRLTDVFFCLSLFDPHEKTPLHQNRGGETLAVVLNGLT